METQSNIVCITLRTRSMTQCIENSLTFILFKVRLFLVCVFFFCLKLVSLWPDTRLIELAVCQGKLIEMIRSTVSFYVCRTWIFFLLLVFWVWGQKTVTHTQILNTQNRYKSQCVITATLFICTRTEWK